MTGFVSFWSTSSRRAGWCDEGETREALWMGECCIVEDEEEDEDEEVDRTGRLGGWVGGRTACSGCGVIYGLGRRRRREERTMRRARRVSSESRSNLPDLRDLTKRLYVAPLAVPFRKLARWQSTPGPTCHHRLRLLVFYLRVFPQQALISVSPDICHPCPYSPFLWLSSAIVVFRPMHPQSLFVTQRHDNSTMPQNHVTFYTLRKDHACSSYTFSALASFHLYPRMRHQRTADVVLLIPVMLCQSSLFSQTPKTMLRLYYNSIVCNSLPASAIRVSLS
jgi:hypothetical protein